MIRPVLFVLLCSCAASAAHASAWTQEAGEGQVILTAVHSESDKGFDADGDVVDINDYEKNEAYLLAEYGVTDELTVFATPSFSDVAVDNSANDVSGLGFTEIGARYRLAQGGGAVLSVQGSARLHGERRADALAQGNVDGNEYDARALAGYGWGEGAGSGFADVQAGYRWRDGAAPNEFHLDATFGVRPADKLSLIVQSFNTLSDGAATGGADYAYHNLQASAVVDLSDSVSLQAGGLMTVAGENALRERGLIAGLWLRF